MGMTLSRAWQKPVRPQTGAQLRYWYVFRNLSISIANITAKSLFEQLPERLTSVRVTAKNKRSAPSPSRAISQGMRSGRDFSPTEAPRPIQRATTFPVSNSLYDSEGRFRTNTMSNPNLRQHFQEAISPTSVSFAGTPNSSGTDNSVQPPEFKQQPDFNVSQSLSPDGFPDLSAMMFPSGDPFAYPNQPMTEFDNSKQENIADMLGTRAPPFVPNGISGSGMYDDLEGQLFGPLPPYMMQGQQFFDASGQMGVENNILSLCPQPMNYNYTPNVEVNFDGILAGGDNDWSNLVMDQQRKS